MRPIAGTSINGYPLPLAERFAAMRGAGFDAVMLWWGAGEKQSRAERALLARASGLLIANAHAETADMNALWLPGEAGEKTSARVADEITACAENGVDTLVLHLTNGASPPPASAIGLARLKALVALAEDRRVRLALENVRDTPHVAFALNALCSAYAGLCFDSGHWRYWTPQTDWLGRFAGRVFCVHLHDNRGDSDAHLHPGAGDIDWPRLAEALRRAGFAGCVGVESEKHAQGAYANDTLADFLHAALESGRRIRDLLDANDTGGETR